MGGRPSNWARTAERSHASPVNSAPGAWTAWPRRISTRRSAEVAVVFIDVVEGTNLNLRSLEELGK